MQDALLTYPYVIVRLRCDDCHRHGGYRLIRLALKYGPDITLDDLLIQLTKDCPWLETRGRFARGCKAYYADFGNPPRAPDMPAQPLRLVAGGRK